MLTDIPVPKQASRAPLTACPVRLTRKEQGFLTFLAANELMVMRADRGWEVIRSPDERNALRPPHRKVLYPRSIPTLIALELLAPLGNDEDICELTATGYFCARNPG